MSAPPPFHLSWMRRCRMRTQDDITVYPNETDVFGIDQLLHQPEMFLFESGRTAKQESYLDVETKNRQFKFRFLCAPDREPKLQSIVLKSIASPDDAL